MRDVDYAEWRKQRKKMLPVVAKMRADAAGRPLRRKSRTPEEAEMILRTVRGMMQRRYDEGKLVRVGPRDFVLKAQQEEHTDSD